MKNRLTKASCLNCDNCSLEYEFCIDQEKICDVISKLKWYEDLESKGLLTVMTLDKEEKTKPEGPPPITINEDFGYTVKEEKIPDETLKTILILGKEEQQNGVSK